MAVGIDRQAAGATDRPPGLDERARALDEGGGLRPREAEAGLGGVGRLRGLRRRALPRLRLLAPFALLLFSFLVVLLLRQLLGDDEDAVGALVVGDAERADHPGLRHRLEESQVLGQFPGVGKIREELGEIFRERAHLLLLELESDDTATLAGLEVEDAAPRRAH